MKSVVLLCKYWDLITKRVRHRSVLNVLSDASASLHQQQQRRAIFELQDIPPKPAVGGLASAHVNVNILKAKQDIYDLILKLEQVQQAIWKYLV